MLKVADCRALAEQRLSLIAANSEADLVLLEQVLELGNTAAFSYQSDEYLKTGNFLAALAGNGPILVHKISGAVDLAGTALPVEEYIKDFEVRNCANAPSLDEDARLLNNLVPLWHAEMAWANELLTRTFNLKRAQDILAPEYRGRKKIPGTNWFYRTHGIGVDVYRTPEVGGIDFDFDKPEPDAWRLGIFLARQVNAGSLSYESYRHLVEDEERLQAALQRFFRHS